MADASVDLVGLVGRKRSGKDTAALGLMIRGWQKAAFATPLREVVKTMFLLTDADCNDPDRKEQPGPMGVSYRRGMQAVGTELVRDQLSAMLPEVGQEGFWIQHMRRRIARARETGTKLVITDIRFRDEAEAILALGGILVHVRRPDIEIADNHPSETGVDDVVEALAPPVVDNDSTPAALQTRLQEVVAGASSQFPSHA
jgi:hypothetical protein